MLPLFTEKVLSLWKDIFPGEPRPSGLSYLGFPGSIEGSTSTFLAFAEGRDEPLFAAKLHRKAHSLPKFDNECQILKKIAASGSALADSAPSVLFSDRINGIEIMAQSILKGQPLTIGLTEEGTPDLNDFRQNVAQISPLLQDLHDIGTEPSPEKQSAVILEEMDEFLSTFDLSPEEREYTLSLKEFFAACYEFKPCWQHGDFCRHNLLVSPSLTQQNRLSVIDWTDSMPRGFPLHDFFFFLATYYLQARKQTGIEGFLEAFRQTFLSREPYGAAVKQTILDFAAALKIEQSWIGPLFALFLVRRALYDARMVAVCLKDGRFPRLNVFMARELGLDYGRIGQAQYWVHFFKIFAAKRRDFIE